MFPSRGFGAQPPRGAAVTMSTAVHISGGRRWARRLGLTWMALWAAVLPAQDNLETHLSSDAWKQMDQFEAYALSRADKYFGKKEYKQAEVEYDSFILEYPKSRAVPYALMRKGRTRQLVDKRYEAIKVYNEVLDYFPDDINYAAASLYYIGLAHQENGNPVEAMKAFTEMAQDKDYRQHRLAARAILALGDYLVKQEKAEEAVKFYEQLAVDFRTRMAATANDAIRKALYHHVRRASNERRVRELYVKTSGFGHNPLPANKVKPVDQLLDDTDFVEAVRGLVREFGSFDEKAVAQRNDYYRYWVKVFENRFPAWDDFRLQVSDWQMVYEESRDLWAKRADAQFRRVKPDFDRIIRWLQRCWGRSYPERVTEYYNLVDFTKIDNGQIWTLMTTLYDHCGQQAMGLNLFHKFDFEKMTEKVKEDLVQYMMARSEDYMRKALATLKDQERAEYLLLTYFVQRQDHKRGIPQADIVAKSPQYADYALWEKSGFLIQAARYEEAIAVCRQVDRGAATFYRIADCYVKLGKIDQAVQQLREVENFFKDESARACFRIAQLYGAAGRRKEQVAVLREVGHKYKDTPEASHAHEALENMGFKTFEGVEAAED